jgi:hypothetical protein
MIEKPTPAALHHAQVSRMDQQIARLASRNAQANELLGQALHWLRFLWDGSQDDVKRLADRIERHL